MALIAVFLAGADAKVLVAAHALIMESLGALSRFVAARALLLSRADAEILVTSDTLLVKSILAAGHHVIAHSPLMAGSAMLRRLGIALLIVVMAVIAVQPVFLGVGVVVEHACLAQCRLMTAIRRMALTARIGHVLAQIRHGMMTVLAVESVSFAVGLVIKQDFAALVFKHLADRGFRAFGRQDGITQKPYYEADSQQANR